MTGQFELKKAAYQALTADATLMAQISGVYDAVPEGSAYPYVTIGALQARDWSSKTTAGSDFTLNVHAYARTAGRKAVIAILERVYQVLRQASFSLTGYALVHLRSESSEVMLEDDGLTYRGTLRLRILVQSTS